MGNLDATVKYEPLKVLMVGDANIHEEVNALIVAWKLNKGENEIGKALAAFLRDFREEPTVVGAAEASEGPAPVPSQTSADASPQLQTKERSPRFWADVVKAALKREGGGDELVAESCFEGDTSRRYSEGLTTAIGHMLEKNRAGMRRGLREI